MRTTGTSTVRVSSADGHLRGDGPDNHADADRHGGRERRLHDRLEVADADRGPDRSHDDGDRGERQPGRGRRDGHGHGEPQRGSAVASTVLTIVDDDDEVKPRIKRTTSADGSSPTIAEDGGVATVEVSTGGAMFDSARTITLSLSGTATKGADYMIGSESLTLDVGQTAVTTTVTGIDDDLDDDNETVVVSATLGANGRRHAHHHDHGRRRSRRGRVGHDGDGDRGQHGGLHPGADQRADGERDGHGGPGVGRRGPVGGPGDADLHGEATGARRRR